VRISASGAQTSSDPAIAGSGRTSGISKMGEVEVPLAGLKLFQKNYRTPIKSQILTTPLLFKTHIC
jgi:hypothetical protein